jgi:hypothetical protein
MSSQPAAVSSVGASSRDRPVRRRRELSDGAISSFLTSSLTGPFAPDSQRKGPDRPPKPASRVIDLTVGDHRILITADLATPGQTAAAQPPSARPRDHPNRNRAPELSGREKEKLT